MLTEDNGLTVLGLERMAAVMESNRQIEHHLLRTPEFQRVIRQRAGVWRADVIDRMDLAVQLPDLRSHSARARK